MVLAITSTKRSSQFTTYKPTVKFSPRLRWVRFESSIPLVKNNITYPWAEVDIELKLMENWLSQPDFNQLILRVYFNFCVQFSVEIVLDVLCSIISLLPPPSPHCLPHATISSLSSWIQVLSLGQISFFCKPFLWVWSWLKYIAFKTKTNELLPLFLGNKKITG